MCLRFIVHNVDNEDENVKPNALSAREKKHFSDLIKVKFVQDLNNVTGVTIKNIGITFTGKEIIMKGYVPASVKRAKLYGSTLARWISVMDEKSVYQYAPIDNLALLHVYMCK